MKIENRRGENEGKWKIGYMKRWRVKKIGDGE